MNTDTIIFNFILWACVVIILLIFEYLRRPRCKKCKTPLKLMGFKDPLSINITKRISIGPIIRGIPRDETLFYGCPKCGTKMKVKNKIWN